MRSRVRWLLPFDDSHARAIPGLTRTAFCLVDGVGPNLRELRRWRIGQGEYRGPRPRFAPVNPSGSSADPSSWRVGKGARRNQLKGRLLRLPTDTKKPRGTPGFSKRRGGDSNPRYGFPHTAFPVLHNRPLCHLSKAFSTTQWHSTGRQSLLEQSTEEIRLQRLLWRPRLSLHVAGQQRLLALLQQQQPTADALTDGIPHSNAAR
jgi:hypothetical protein